MLVCCLSCLRTCFVEKVLFVLTYIHASYIPCIALNRLALPYFPLPRITVRSPFRRPLSMQIGNMCFDTMVHIQSRFKKDDFFALLLSSRCEISEGMEVIDVFFSLVGFWFGLLVLLEGMVFC